MCGPGRDHYMLGGGWEPGAGLVAGSRCQLVRQAGSDPKLLCNAHPHVEAPLSKCGLHAGKANQHVVEVLALVRLVARQLLRVAQLDTLVLRCARLLRRLQRAERVLQVADLARAVLVAAKHLRALLLQLRNTPFLLFVVLCQRSHRHARVLALTECRADRGQQGQVVVQLAELHGALHRRGPAEAAEPHRRHANAARVGGNGLRGGAALGVLPAAQPVLVLKLGHLDEGQPDVAQHIAHLLQPLDQVLRLARGVRQLHLKFDHAGVLCLQRDLLLGQRHLGSRALAVPGHRRLELLEHAQKVVALLGGLRSLGRADQRAVVTDQLLRQPRDALQHGRLHGLQVRPLGRQRQLAVMLQKNTQFRGLRDDRVRRELHQKLLKCGAACLDEVLGHALPLHHVFLRAGRHKVTALRHGQ
mmetsp:Transcript_16893/g.42402  ORF Transcript_16893/g.42402 Transcript_16893/m.42402 type:complete len:416 (-) Transcript_16893:127-1374(-)